MKKFWAIAVMGMALLTSCANTIDEPISTPVKNNFRSNNSARTAVKAEPKDSVECKYFLDDEEMECLYILVNMCLSCDCLREYLQEEYPELYSRVIDPEHEWCSECRLKVLRICDLHTVFGDTIAENDIWEDWLNFMEHNRLLKIAYYGCV